jgi:hypothetical protein
MIFNKSQMMRLKETWRKVIDPRKDFKQGVQIEKKQKLTEVEKRLANTYIEEGAESEESDDKEVEAFIDL